MEPTIAQIATNIKPELINKLHTKTRSCNPSVPGYHPITTPCKFRLPFVAGPDEKLDILDNFVSMSFLPQINICLYLKSREKHSLQIWFY